MFIQIPHQNRWDQINLQSTAGLIIAVFWFFEGDAQKCPNLKFLNISFTLFDAKVVI